MKKFIFSLFFLSLSLSAFAQESRPPQVDISPYENILEPWELEYWIVLSAEQVEADRCDTRCAIAAYEELIKNKESLLFSRYGNRTDGKSSEYFRIYGLVKVLMRGNEHDCDRSFLLFRYRDDQCYLNSMRDSVHLIDSMYVEQLQDVLKSQSSPGQ